MVRRTHRPMRRSPAVVVWCVLACMCAAALSSAAAQDGDAAERVRRLERAYESAEGLEKRLELIEALGSIDHDDARDVLERVAENDPFEAARVAALARRGEDMDKRDAITLVESAVGASSPTVRVWAARALRRASPNLRERAMDALAEYAAQGRPQGGFLKAAGRGLPGSVVESLRLNAGAAVGEIGGADAREALEDLAEDNDPVTLRAAVQGIGRMPGGDAHDILARLLARARGLDLRAEVLTALVNHGGEEALTLLADLDEQYPLDRLVERGADVIRHNLEVERKARIVDEDGYVTWDWEYLERERRRLRWDAETHVIVNDTGSMDGFRPEADDLLHVLGGPLQRYSVTLVRGARSEWTVRGIVLTVDLERARETLAGARQTGTDGTDFPLGVAVRVVGLLPLDPRPPERRRIEVWCDKPAASLSRTVRALQTIILLDDFSVTIHVPGDDDLNKAEHAALQRMCDLSGARLVVEGD